MDIITTIAVLAVIVAGVILLLSVILSVVSRANDEPEYPPHGDYMVDIKALLNKWDDKHE